MRQAIVLHLAAASAALLSGLACSPVHPQIEADFIDGLKHGASVTVLPAIVREGARVTYDVEASRKIAAYLGRSGVAVRTEYATVRVSGWHANEARMARESAAAAARHLVADPHDTRYALVPEFLIGRDGEVAGVHAYVVRNDGEIAGILVLNSHHPLFQSARPRTRAECTDVVISAIDQKWVNQ